MLSLSSLKERILGILHDVIEDTGVVIVADDGLEEFKERFRYE